MRPNPLLDIALAAAYRECTGKIDLGHRLRELEERFTVTRGQLCHAAMRLNLRCIVRKTWTPAEDQVVRAHAGELSSAKIGKMLGRSDRSIRTRIALLKLSRKVEYGGYEWNELATALSVSQATISMWVRKGWLVQTPSGSITDISVEKFILEHFDCLSLKRVDEGWLKLMMREALQKTARKLARAA